MTRSVTYCPDCKCDWKTGAESQCICQKKWTPSNELIATMAATIYGAKVNTFAGGNMKFAILNAKEICRLISESHNEKSGDEEE